MSMCSTPDVPDYEEAARDAVVADLQTYPTRYMVDAASRIGVPENIGGTTYDFTGLGDIDNARVISDQMAQTLLDLQRTRGPEIIRQRIAELKAADPQGYAMRKTLFDRILASAEANPDRPMAEQLQAEILSELQRGGKLDSKGREQVQEQVRGGQVKRGIVLGNAPVAQETQAMVSAGDAMRNARQQQALAFLESGASPEDVQYRRFQQALGNLGSFVNNETPTSQFRTLSSAGNGAVPFVGGGNNAAAINTNAGAQGAQWASNIYSGNMNWASNQVNPFIAGLSTGASTLNTMASLGLGK